VLGEVVRVGQEPSDERRDALADVAARSIKRLSRTGKESQEIQEWINNHFPAWEQMVTEKVNFLTGRHSSILH
jgi:hypothetical protein